MSRFFRIVALLLLAVWLPVTKHCMLEAAGILDVASQVAGTSRCCVDSEPCADDSCEVVERGLTLSSSSILKIQAAQFLATVDFLCVPTDADRNGPATLAHLSGDWDRLLEWVPAWHFERRAAHPPRAPSFVG